MLDIKCPKGPRPIFLLIAIGALCLAMSCAPSSTKRKVAGLAPETPAQIQSISVASPPSDAEARIAIINSRTTPYTAFKLAQPLRLIVDVTAQPAEDLTSPDVTGDRIIKALTVDKIKDEPLVTRVTANLYQDVEYSVQETDGTIDVLLSLKKPAETVEPPVMAAKEEALPSEPRIFFAPDKTKANQILGIDFFLLPQGKSRVTVTTKKRAPYELSRKDSMTLLLEVQEVTIPPELVRHIDSSYFKGVVDRITPTVRVADKDVDLEIKLREMVPYHVFQTDQEIQIDFNKTSVEPPAKTITETRLVEKQIVAGEKPQQAQPAASPVVSQPRVLERRSYKRYTGEKITLDFANADIRNILKLIGEVSKKNLVWGPEVKGTVSMRLKNVPWDQALNIVLESNDLGMIEEGNIIWVTTKGKIKNLEKERQDKLKAEQERMKAAREAAQEAQELEPLQTEYVRVDFASAESDIKPHIEKILSKRGSVTVDSRTNTLIITDIASSIEKAKNVAKEFDMPVKQIMIEARIVDASTSLSRDLGVQWTSGTPGTNFQYRNNTGVLFGIPTDATYYPGGGRLYGGSFSTNAPVDWGSNIGLSFGKLSSSGLGALTLNASLALAETEGKAKIISAPKVIASNGQEAVISRGDIIYRNIVTADTIEVEELEATLQLTVTPYVSFNDYITMDVEVNDDKAYTDGSGKTEKRIKTQLMIMTGDTVVIGGIYKEDKSEAEAGIPWLRNIPILGWLFNAQRKSAERSELLIFITPRVVNLLSKES